MSEWDYEAQRAAERRLYVADDLLWSDEQGLEGPDEDDETVGAYCGCYTVWCVKLWMRHGRTCTG